jgi:septal ring factor EnvC (AmiA/AmiB activator)
MTHKAFRPARALLLALLAPAAIFVAQAAPPNPDKVNNVVGEQSQIDKAAAASQQRINQLDDQAQTLVGQYRQTVAETESIKAYNHQLSLQVKSQLEEMDSMQKQLAEIERTSREVLPMMQKMVDTFEQFVALDVPFLPEERKNRVQGLKDMMGRADVTISEKYRRITEAYSVEMEYGRTIEAYEGKLGEGDQAKTVEFLRAGRVALMYQTLDGSETGYWDADQKKWVADDDYSDAVKKGLRVAKKTGAPDLMIVPVHAPMEGKS